MTKLTLYLLTAYSFVFSALSEPLIRLGPGVQFYGVYSITQVGYVSGVGGGTLISAGSRIDLVPALSESFHVWYSYDLAAGDYYTLDYGLQPNAYESVWHFAGEPIHAGYNSGETQWSTNCTALVYPSSFVTEIRVDVSPLYSGVVWIDWNQDSTVRVVWSSEAPPEFGKYLYGGVVNPIYNQTATIPIPNNKKNRKRS